MTSDNVTTDIYVRNYEDDTIDGTLHSTKNLQADYNVTAGNISSTLGCYMEYDGTDNWLNCTSGLIKMPMTVEVNKLRFGDENRYMMWNDSESYFDIYTDTLDLLFHSMDVYFVSGYSLYLDAFSTGGGSYIQDDGSNLYLYSGGSILMGGDVNVDDNEITNVNALTFSNGESINNWVDGWFTFTGGVNASGYDAQFDNIITDTINSIIGYITLGGILKVHESPYNRVCVDATGSFADCSSTFEAIGSNPFITVSRTATAQNVGFAIGQSGSADFWDIYSPIGVTDLVIANIATAQRAFWINATNDKTAIGKDLIVGWSYLNGNDITVQFGETTAGKLTNKGFFKWMEDEDYFQWLDDLLITAGEYVYFRDTALYITSLADGVLNLVADGTIKLSAPIINTTGDVYIANGKNVFFNVTREIKIPLTRYKLPGVNPPEEVIVDLASVFAFDKTTNEEIYGTFHVPEDYKDGSNIYIAFYWAPACAGDTGTVSWCIEAKKTTHENNEQINGSGTRNACTIDSGQSLIYEGLEAPNLLIAGPTLVDDDEVFYKVYRNATSDTLDCDADLYMTTVYYTSYRLGDEWWK